MKNEINNMEASNVNNTSFNSFFNQTTSNINMQIVIN